MWTRFLPFGRRPRPLISLVLPVKNAMPHVQKTIEALHRQTYRNFELLVQDGGSTDETLNYLRSIQGLPRVEIDSRPDQGVGQAYNRGIARTKGELVCLIAADEYLDDDALEKGVRWFRRYPKAAVVYGGMRLTDASDRICQVFIPPKFDLTKFLHNEIFPTAAGFLNRERLGPDLRYDETLRTCPDYDFWIRLGSRFTPEELVVVPEPILTARGDRTSMSYRVESFDHFTRDKLFVLDRYLRSLGDESKTTSLRATASAGILTWAAECVFQLEDCSPEFLKWCGEAAKFDPHSVRLARLAKLSEAFNIDESGQFRPHPAPQLRLPGAAAVPVPGLVALNHLRSDPEWRGAKIRHGTTVRVSTVPKRWHYSAWLPASIDEDRKTASWFWAKLSVQVHSGQVGVGVWALDDIFDERLLTPEDGRVDVLVRLNRPATRGVMVRNGSLGGRGEIEIFSATVEALPKPPAALVAQAASSQNNV